MEMVLEWSCNSKSELTHIGSIHFQNQKENLNSYIAENLEDDN